ncbi:MAG: hypothetical protein IJI56_05535 [Firmicutes bacterium]|nr:hypothetical protein [Bacillota bacterium]
MKDRKTKAGQYMIELQKWRSIMALAACCITLLCTAAAVIWAIVWHMEESGKALHAFRFFTTLSNSLTFFAAGFIFPYAINGIRMKRLIYPRWLSLVHYSGTVCTTLTFVFAMAFILPYDRKMALGGSNFFLHLVCPLAVLISFMMVESCYDYRKKDTLVCLIPLMIYSLVYTTMVVFVGEANGGWPDMYKLNTFVPFYVGFPAVWLLALGISYAINRVSSALYRKRQEDMLFSLNRYIDPIELKLEVYELGKLYGASDDENDLSIPFDLLTQLADHYTKGTDIDDLYNMYTAGMLAGVKEKGR